MKILMAGNMARDAVMAERLVQEDCEVHVASSIRNPSLMLAAGASGGSFYEVDDITDTAKIGEIAASSGADLFFTNSDEALANGVVDVVSVAASGILIASPDKASAKIEWDKFEGRDIIAEIDEEQGTEYNPLYFGVNDASGALSAVDFFRAEGKEVVIKPPGLSGGKGVKVMGPHLETYEDAISYSMEIIRRYGSVDIEQKIEGHEFTLQCLTDGSVLIVPPITYDYPFREDRDKGPGTGGMGSFTMPPGEQLPFLTDEDRAEVAQLMRSVLTKLSERGLDYKGVLYGSFFKTKDGGIKVTEFNARMGDPEGLNVIDLLSRNTSLAQVLRAIAEGNLCEDDVHFEPYAAAAVYLVSPDYAYKDSAEQREFCLDLQEIAFAGCRAYFGAATQIDERRYVTSGPSRTVAITSIAHTPWEAQASIHQAIRAGVKGPLQYRKDIADRDYLRIDLSQ